MRYVLALAVALGCIQPAKAAGTGMDLQQWCSGGGADGLRCMTFIFGFISGLSYAADGKVLCVPDDLTAGQSALIVQKWMRDHPEELNRSMGIVAGRALSAAYACKQRAR
jgi:hypothetical protein